jgi:hypothetical protein
MTYKKSAAQQKQPYANRAPAFTQIKSSRFVNNPVSGHAYAD